MKNKVILLMITTLIIKMFGLGRDVVLSYFFGASNISDAYLISLSIPIVIIGFITEGISVGFIPLYSSIISGSDNKSANGFTSNVINVVLLISIFMIGICVFGSDILVKIFAHGFDDKTMKLASNMTKITSFSIIAVSQIAIFKTVYASQ